MDLRAFLLSEKQQVLVCCPFVFATKKETGEQFPSACLFLVGLES